VTKPLRVPLYYDVASTLCYLAQRLMGRMADDLVKLDIELVWTPIDLAGITGWTRGAAVDGERRANALRVARELDVEVRIPTRWLDSRDASAVATSLGGSEREATWRERVFSAVYEEGRDLDEPGMLGRLALDVDLDLGALLTAQAHARLAEATLRARRREVTGVPTFMLGEWPFGGIQEELTMRSVLSRWAAKQRP
jgi:predicted DsbA family dithiol-disulfide isomerase